MRKPYIIDQFHMLGHTDTTLMMVLPYQDLVNTLVSELHLGEQTAIELAHFVIEPHQSASCAARLARHARGARVPALHVTST